MNGMTRRRFAGVLGGLGMMGLVEPHALVRAFADTPQRLSRLAYRTAATEGGWKLTKIEGKVPRNLNGTLYRTAPGQKDNHGIVLKHLFDGDAYACGFSFRDGAVTFRGRFIETPERVAETNAGKMLFREFGTLPPEPQRRGKNQPSVNIIAWDGRLLGLSEGGHPSAIDPKTFDFQGYWDFHGTLPPNVTFTAHPKFDPATGEGYAYGIQQGPGLPLTVYRMEKTGTLKQLYALPQNGFYIVHDVMISREHIIFVIPPVRPDLPKLFSGQASIADALVYFEREPTRVIVLRKDGTGKPVTIEQPAGFVFHHGNAFEKDGRLVIDTLLTPNSKVLDMLNSWSKDTLPRGKDQSARFIRLVLDPVAGTVVSRTEMGEHQEFPRFDQRLTGQDARYTYVAESLDMTDAFRFTGIVRHDLKTGTSKKFEAGDARTFGEPVFVPHPGKSTEDRGWLLVQGYDGRRDENYLEIRDAGTLDFTTRIWTGTHYPLGFHGNFVPDWFVA